ncbi:rubrerythrin [Elusimicrobium posterum]|uniref:rubrerythrin n=1 Tax=Elusimicrobium posterum TaxID=3116653 RepID=UPI003C78CFCE
MASVKGTKTEVNLLRAFAGESQARNRYTYYAGVAKKEGYVQISQIFEETANQEKEHAKRLFKFLEGGAVEITYSYPAGVISTTADNLKEAFAGEDEEWEHMYPEFAQTAREEGFEEIALAMEHIAIAEKQHSKRFQGVLKNIVDNTVFKKDQKITWRCINCGYIMEGAEAPEKCPACAHPKSYFEILAENW